MRGLVALLIVLGSSSEALCQFTLSTRTSPNPPEWHVETLNYGLDVMTLLRACRSHLSPDETSALQDLIARKYAAIGYTAAGIAASLSELERHVPSLEWPQEQCLRGVDRLR